MYGTVMRARLAAGKTVDDLRAVMGPNWKDAESHGAVWAEFGVSDQDPQMVVGIIHFADRESYYANAERPETNSNYEQMMSVLAEAPEWTDVSWVAMAGTPKQLAPA